MENPTVQNSLFFPRDIFLISHDNFRKTARDLKKLTVTFFGKIKLPMLNFFEIAIFLNSNTHVFFKSVTYSVLLGIISEVRFFI